MRWTIALLAFAAVLTSPLPAGSSPRPANTQLPNLVPLPAFDLSLGTDQDGARILSFAVATANRGDFALDLRFESEGASTQSAAAHQCIAWVTDRVCAEREVVGSFEWHPEHAHHHFRDFALYEIRSFRRGGIPDMRPRGLIATSGKMSFCLIDVEQDREPDSLLYVQPHPLYYTCLVGAGFQGISPGWRDVYSNGTQGQWFPLDNLADGDHALVVTSDPAGRLLETNERDNRSVLGFRLEDGTRKVDVFCVSEPGTLRCEDP